MFFCLAASTECTRMGKLLILPILLILKSSSSNQVFQVFGVPAIADPIADAALPNLLIAYRSSLPRPCGL
jgi:hypothetical protein